MRYAIVTACVAAWLLAGCDKGSAQQAKPPPAATTPASRAPYGPAAAQTQPSADAAEEDPGMEIVVKNPTTRTAKDEYVQDDNVPTGRLVGVLKWSAPILGRDKVPPPQAYDTPELLGIKDPAPGEVDYFKNLKLKAPRYWADFYMHPTSAVIIIHGLKTGRRAMYSRATFLVREGNFRPHVQFTPQGERVMFGTYDSYPTDAVMTRLNDGKQVMDEKITAFDRDTIKPLGGGGLHFTARPTMAQSPVLSELAGYEIKCKRHPWKRAYVFTVDNPYAIVADGPFTIDHVPVGKWKLEAWHPAYKVLTPEVEIEIKKDESAEIAIPIEPPPELKAPPKEPAK